jgi:hypothetical protein
MGTFDCQDTEIMSWELKHKTYRMDTSVPKPRRNLFSRVFLQGWGRRGVGYESINSNPMGTFVADTGALQLIFAHAHHVLPDRLLPYGPHHLPCCKYKKGINSKKTFEFSLNRFQN